jgi:hypothetical protein
MSCREAKAANRSPTLTIIAINWVVLASSSGEQVRAGLRESDEGAAVVEFKPAAFDGEREARRILFRCGPIDVQERAVDLLDVDAAGVVGRAPSGGPTLIQPR